MRPWVEAVDASSFARTFEERAASLEGRRLPCHARSFEQRDQPLYDRLLEGARSSWYCRELQGGHYAMLTEPQAVAAALTDLPGITLSPIRSTARSPL